MLPLLTGNVTALACWCWWGLALGSASKTPVSEWFRTWPVYLFFEH